MRRVVFMRNPSPDTIGNSVDEFLAFLGGPACIFLDGDNPNHTRGFVTLLHGNEPSGVMALFRWLKSGAHAAVNIVCLVASVSAATTEPRFSHRMLPDHRDLNRCFRPPFEDTQGHLAEEILEILRVHHPEAIIDMHNTSGSGPSFGVCTHLDRQHDALVSIFTQKLIISNLGLGALMDISEYTVPTVTIEVGGREDEEAHELAYEGLCRYFTADDVLHVPGEEAGVETLHDPLRLELKPGTSLVYGDQPQAGYDVTLRPDIENYNFGTVTHESHLGWVAQEATHLFSAIDAHGQCAVQRLVRIEDGKLYPARALKLFMITNNADIARSDCLFYAVADDGRTITP